MNYRHAFHAGNFADTMKHLMLSRMLAYMVRKPAPLRYIDTHAGLGWYDLDGSEAARTGEWRDGIGRVDPAKASAGVREMMEPYLRAVGPRDEAGMPLSYPGSPAIAQEMLRASDRMLLCELHPDDAPRLRLALKGDKRAKVLVMDGYRMLNASVPPPERRGLVLIDPPFEDRAEFDRMAEAFAEAYRKWPTGIYALWYPIKDAVPPARFLRHLHTLALPRFLELELFDDNAASAGLRGSGLFVANPPYTLAAEAERLLAFLADCFDRPERRWRWRVEGGGG